KSIKEYTKSCQNVYEPIYIDISKNLDDWTEKTNDGKLLSSCHGYFDFILNINMIHITPFICTEMLFKNSSNLLKSNGMLFTYGPYSFNHVISPESNVRFNEMLKRDDPNYGIRDISDLENIANANFFSLANIHDLPANNKLLVWKKD
ncbi:Methyltransferase-like 26 B, partial [Polypedilum vanderplanki]